MTDSKFKIGDRVSDMGRKGTVSSIDTFIHVEFDDGLFSFFLLDGRREREHSRPSLKKLKKKKARYIQYTENGFSGPSGHIYSHELYGHWLKDCGTKKPKGA